MSNGIKRIGKGLFAIFMIKLTLLGGVLAFQACQTESNFDDGVSEEAKTNFLAALQVSNQKIREVKLKKISYDTHSDDKYGFTAKDDENPLSLKQICLESLLATIDTVSANVSDTIDTSGVQTLGDVFDIADQTNTRPVVVDDNVDDTVVDDPATSTTLTLDCFSISTVTTAAVMEPTLHEAKEYLIAKGLTNTDIQNLFTADADGAAIEEYNLVPTVMMLIAEEQSANTTASVNFMTLFGNSAHASRIGQCAGDALGVSAVAEVIRLGVNSPAGKKLLKKALRKVASRTLGWIGVAVFVYEFGDCMDWW